MTQDKNVALFRGIIKAYPQLLEMSESDAMNRLSACYSSLTRSAATREHIKLALAQHKGNAVKRAWDLKQRYIIAMILENPNVSIKSINKSIQSLFNQRTRASVIDSCYAEATRMLAENKYPVNERFIMNARGELAARATESNVLELAASTTLGPAPKRHKPRPAPPNHFTYRPGCTI